MPNIANESVLSLLSSTPSTNTAISGLSTIQVGSGFKQFLVGDYMTSSIPQSMEGFGKNSMGKGLPFNETAIAALNIPVDSNAIDPDLIESAGGLTSIDIEQLSFGTSAMGVKIPTFLQDMVQVKISQDPVKKITENSNVLEDIKSNALGEISIGIAGELNELSVKNSSDICISSNGFDEDTFDQLYVDSVWQQLGVVQIIPAKIEVLAESGSFTNLDGNENSEINIEALVQLILDSSLEITHVNDLPEELKAGLEPTEQGTYILPVFDVMQYVKSQSNSDADINAGQVESFTRQLVNHLTMQGDASNFAASVDTTFHLTNKNESILGANDKHKLVNVLLEKVDNLDPKNSHKNAAESILKSIPNLDSGDADLRQMEAILAPKSSQHTDSDNVSVVFSPRDMGSLKTPFANQIIGEVKVSQENAILSSNRAEWFHGLNHRIQWMLSQNLQKADIRVDPPELGTVHIRIHQSGDQTSVVFSSQHAVVREALESTVHRLRESMEQQGLNLIQADVKDQQHGQSNSSQQENIVASYENMDSDNQDDEVITTVETLPLVDTHV